jgi:hypothetical protein
VARLRRERCARVLVLAQDPLPGADHPGLKTVTLTS